MIQIEKYATDVTPQGYAYLARETDESIGRGVFGFGSTPEGARADYNRQAEIAIVNLTNYALRSGYLAQAITSFQVRLAVARTQDSRETRDIWLDRLDADMTDTLRLVDEADAVIRADIASRSGPPPLRKEPSWPKNEKTEKGKISTAQ